MAKGATIGGSTVVGWTLAIILGAVIAALCSWLSGDLTESSGNEIDQMRLVGYANALQRYQQDVGSFPEPELGLSALLRAPPSVQGWKGPYTKRAEILSDHWNRAFVYRLSADKQRVELCTLGADGLGGGELDNADQCVMVKSP